MDSPVKTANTPEDRSTDYFRLDLHLVIFVLRLRLREIMKMRWGIDGMGRQTAPECGAKADLLLDNFLRS